MIRYACWIIQQAFSKHFKNEAQLTREGRMAPFFTRGGDDGYTGVLGEGRVPKNDAIMEALGALDEANACLGVARPACRRAPGVDG